MCNGSSTISSPAVKSNKLSLFLSFYVLSKIFFTNEIVMSWIFQEAQHKWNKCLVSLGYTDCIPCRGVRLPFQIRSPGYDTIISSDGKVPLLEIWEEWNIFSLPLLPGSLIPGGSNCQSFIYGSNRSVWKLFIFDRNNWCHVILFVLRIVT